MPATYLENLIISRDRVALELATGDIGIDYSIDGQSVSWTAYRAALLAELDKYIDLINSSFGPVEEVYQITPVGRRD